MRLAVVFLAVFVAAGCMRPVGAKNESERDRLRRGHIYAHIVEQMELDYLKSVGVRKSVAEFRGSKFDEDKPDYKKLVAETYDYVGIEELYDIARFKFGYSEPR